jgi:hypothetical protein
MYKKSIFVSIYYPHKLSELIFSLHCTGDFLNLFLGILQSSNHFFLTGVFPTAVGHCLVFR